MNNVWNNKKIAEEIRNNGYYIFENYFNSEEINKVKKSLLDILHYIKPDEENDLQKKYYQIKKYNSKLKGNWYDIAPYNITMLQLLHKPEMVNFVKEFFNTDVVFSGRPAIHVHDDENDKLLEPHQETAQIARDTLVFWSPLYDTNKENGGLSIHKDSHKHGYFKHTIVKTKPGFKSWTKDYTHVDESISKKFKKIDLVKIDTEGHEFEVLKGMGRSIKNIKYILVEFHNDEIYLSYNPRKIHNYLVKNDFALKTAFKFPFTTWEDRFYFNNKFK